MGQYTCRNFTGTRDICVNPSVVGLVTGHGKASTVPSVTGKTYEEAKEILKKAGFDVEILDSVYVDTLKPLTVMRQLPDADEIVKSNRTVFLIITVRCHQW